MVDMGTYERLQNQRVLENLAAEAAVRDYEEEIYQSIPLELSSVEGSESEDDASPQEVNEINPSPEIRAFSGSSSAQDDKGEEEEGDQPETLDVSDYEDDEDEDGDEPKEELNDIEAAFKRTETEICDVEDSFKYIETEFDDVGVPCADMAEKIQ
ncbi:acidic leucine-rich nuclear phosphoprotein 32 family member B-like [Ptychodera flava]|uniref:acidic leucine-rich nuclear phosphoprotein 32 family member B-like n=1 Tax=Ptychodera flava TaxID=63121 RepID=UPI00396A4921